MLRLPITTRTGFLIYTCATKFRDTRRSARARTRRESGLVAHGTGNPSSRGSRSSLSARAPGASGRCSTTISTSTRTSLTLVTATRSASPCCAPWRTIQPEVVQRPPTARAGARSRPPQPPRSPGSRRPRATERGSRVRSRSRTRSRSSAPCADRLDLEDVPVIVDVLDYLAGGRSSSANRCASDVVVPGRCPMSISAWVTRPATSRG